MIEQRTPLRHAASLTGDQHVAVVSLARPVAHPDHALTLGGLIRIGGPFRYRQRAGDFHVAVTVGNESSVALSVGDNNVLREIGRQAGYVGTDDCVVSRYFGGRISALTGHLSF